MTTKTLSGTYSGGYSLSSSYSALKLTSSAAVGGAGVVTKSTATVTNQGTILPGDALSGHAYSALTLLSGQVVNYGTIAGGASRGTSGGSGGAGVFIQQSAGSVTNYGYISGGAGGAGASGGFGVALFEGGQFTNVSGAVVGGAGGQGGGAGFISYGGNPTYVTNNALIEGGGGSVKAQGGYGVEFLGSNVTITNNGDIYGGGGTPKTRGGMAAYFLEGGTLYNSGAMRGGPGGGGYAHGVDGGYAQGVDMARAGSVFNTGAIVAGAGGAGGQGVLLSSGGSVVNGAANNSTALIEGGAGVQIGGGYRNTSFNGQGTVTNYGVIEGTNGPSVQLNLATDRLIAEAGSQFIGQMEGGGGTLELAGGTGEISGLGGAGVLAGSVSGTFSGFGAYVIDAGGQWTLSGASSIPAGGLTVAGSLKIETATIANGGSISVADGGVVKLKNADIQGGALSASGTGEFKTRAGTNLLDGTVSPVTISGAVVVAQNTGLTLAGAITNGGAITIGAPGETADLIIGSANVTLGGHGVVNLGGGALDEIVGASGAATLTNVGDTISGGGALGAGELTLVNDAGGVIDGDAATILAIDTGANTVTNAGTIEATGGAGTIIDSAVDDNGHLEAAGGNLTVAGAVTGVGSGVINGGTLTFNSSFNQNVAFTGAAGVLVLAASRNYTGQVSGFSLTGGTSLDLEDIGFVASGEASYLGTASSGVLTVSDGVHTARITLVGDYLGSTFTSRSDGHGGTIVVDPSASSGVRDAAAQRFISSMAGMGVVAGTATQATPWVTSHAPAMFAASTRFPSA